MAAGDVSRAAPDQAHRRRGKHRGPPLHRRAQRQVLHALRARRPSPTRSRPRAPRPSPPSGAPSTSSRTRPRWASIRAPWWTRSAISCAPTRTPWWISTATPIPPARASSTWTLSKQRAEAVKSYLVEKYHFPPERMRTVGNGPDKPLETNATPGGPREEPAHRYQGLSEPGQIVSLDHLFEIRRSISRAYARGPGHCGVDRRGAGVVRCSRESEDPAAVFRPRTRRRGGGVRPPVDRVRPARQRLPKLVAHRAGLPLVGRGRHSAGPVDGRLPLAARPRQSRRRAHALHADHGVPAGVHRPVRHGRRR